MRALRAQVQEVHAELDGYLSKWLCGIAPAAPAPGSLAVALYVHAVTVEDITIQTLLSHVAPIYQSEWAGTGPARYSTADLAPLRAYAQRVFSTTDGYLAGLTPQDLDLMVATGPGVPGFELLGGEEVAAERHRTRSPQAGARGHAFHAARERHDP